MSNENENSERGHQEGSMPIELLAEQRAQFARLYEESNRMNDEISKILTDIRDKSQLIEDATSKIHSTYSELENTAKKTETLFLDAKGKNEAINQYHVDIMAARETIERQVGEGAIKLAELKKSSDDSKTYADNITQFYNSIFIGKDGNDSYSNQIHTTANELTLIHSENKQRLEELKKFYNSVFLNTTSPDGKTIPGLKETIELLNTRLDKLISEAEKQLNAITDSSLHNSFFNRAKAHGDEYDKFQTYTLRSSLTLVGITLFFGIIQIIRIFAYEQSFDYHLLIYQISVSLPVVFIAWMYNRNQKIAKKLAEEYYHKSSISEAMTGYRSLYQLKHDSDEYMSLFNEIKQQLNINPAGKIDKFLKLKSPHEQIIDSFANPEAIAKIAEAIKPYLKKDDKESTNTGRQ